MESILKGRTMRDKDPNANTVFMLHIPKTGGRTLIRHLEEWYGRQVVEVETNEDFVGGTSGWREKRAIHGHQFFPFREVMGSPWLTLTVLREPVSRVLSAFRYIERKADHVLHEQFRSRVRSLGDFVMDDTLSFHSVNMQTRMLGSDADLAEIISRHRTGQTSLTESRRRYNQALAVRADTEMLDRAKRRLQRNDVMFGVMEDMNYFVTLVAHRLNQLPPGIVYRENAAPAGRSGAVAGIEFADDEIGLVRDLNALDCELYSFAVEVFQHRHRRVDNCGSAPI